MSKISGHDEPWKTGTQRSNIQKTAWSMSSVMESKHASADCRPRVKCRLRSENQGENATLGNIRPHYFDRERGEGRGAGERGNTYILSFPHPSPSSELEFLPSWNQGKRKKQKKTKIKRKEITVNKFYFLLFVCLFKVYVYNKKRVRETVKGIRSKKIVK